MQFQILTEKVKDLIFAQGFTGLPPLFTGSEISDRTAIASTVVACFDQF